MDVQLGSRPAQTDFSRVRALIGVRVAMYSGEYKASIMAPCRWVQDLSLDVQWIGHRLQDFPYVMHNWCGETDVIITFSIFIDHR